MMTIGGAQDSMDLKQRRCRSAPSNSNAEALPPAGGACSECRKPAAQAMCVRVITVVYHPRAGALWWHRRDSVIGGSGLDSASIEAPRILQDFVGAQRRRWLFRSTNPASDRPAVIRQRAIIMARGGADILAELRLDQNHSRRVGHGFHRQTRLRRPGIGHRVFSLTMERYAFLV